VISSGSADSIRRTIELPRNVFIQPLKIRTTRIVPIFQRVFIQHLKIRTTRIVPIFQRVFIQPLMIRATQFNPIFRHVSNEPKDLAVCVRGLCHFYGEGELRKQVLFQNDLVVRPGEIVIMTGPSGSGKTTLLTLIGTLRRVQEGELHVLGRPLHQAADSALVAARLQLGFIFQAHNLFDSLTAQQNVRMALELFADRGNRANRDQMAQSMLEAVGLGHRIHHKPRHLSGGQKQRVAIARGLVHGPRLVLADEPTAALDEASGRTVVELLKKLAREERVAIILVTHDNRILDIADRIVNMIDGRIASDVVVAEAARISELLNRCEVFRGVTPRTLTQMADKMTIEIVPAGQTIIREGDVGDRFYMIRDGRVSVRQGESLQEVAQLGPGQFFGERALLTGEPRNATIVTTSETILYVLAKPDFDQAIAERASLDQEVRTSLFERS
jgi:putative ABC transport system ATP-binding protein